jgi:hypothetical protein
LRDLNYINSAAKSTKFIFTISLIIPLVMGCGAWALALGAAPKQTLQDNYLGLIGLGIASTAIIAFPIPYIFRWNWETKYFGAGMLSLSSASLLGIYPVLCIGQYSSLPIFIRLTFVGAECILIIRWCRRFIKIYRIIYFKKDLFCCIYNEETSAVYYSQQADKHVVEKLFNFQQFPNPKYFILSGFAAFSLAPFATFLSKFIGVPFIHIFLAIFSTPLNLMFLGLATKGWLVFYFYPMKIKRERNKSVYVDISSQPPKYLKSHGNCKNSV